MFRRFPSLLRSSALLATGLAWCATGNGARADVLTYSPLSPLYNADQPPGTEVDYILGAFGDSVAGRSPVDFNVSLAGITAQSEVRITDFSEPSFPFEMSASFTVAQLESVSRISGTISGPGGSSVPFTESVASDFLPLIPTLHVSPLGGPFDVTVQPFGTFVNPPSTVPVTLTFPPGVSIIEDIPLVGGALDLTLTPQQARLPYEITFSIGSERFDARGTGVPEPGSLGILAAALLALGAVRVTRRAPAHDRGPDATA